MTQNSTVSRISIKASLTALIPLFFAFGCGTDEASSNNPRNPFGEGPAGISLSANGASVVAGDLGSAGNYTVLAKAAISNVTGSAITGNIGLSPAASTYITGFPLSADATNVFSTSSSVVGGGKVYAATYAVPTPTLLTSAIGSMETAYTTAAGRSPPDYNELATGNLGGLTLKPGLYTWTNTVNIPTDFTISGGANDVWIFQIAGDVTMAAAKNVILSGGAQAKNIYWQVAGQVTIGANSHFEGIILCKTAVHLLTLASMNGRILAQTAVTLDNNAVTQP
ncbi:MAG: DUF3494 domain-containing protein [Methylotenera sp.]|nr:DUF3494 domain-containing protein [Oligoflexia bacterium]